jgi:hypothetical protein
MVTCRSRGTAFVWHGDSPLWIAAISVWDKYKDRFLTYRKSPSAWCPTHKKFAATTDAGCKVTILTPRDDYEGSSEYCREAVGLSSKEWRENLKCMPGFPRVRMLLPWRASVTADDKVFFCPTCANSTVTRHSSFGWRGGGGGSGYTGAVVRFNDRLARQYKIGVFR